MASAGLNSTTVGLFLTALAIGGLAAFISSGRLLGADASASDLAWTAASLALLGVVGISVAVGLRRRAPVPVVALGGFAAGLLAFVPVPSVIAVAWY